MKTAKSKILLDIVGDVLTNSSSAEGTEKNKE